MIICPGCGGTGFKPTSIEIKGLQLPEGSIQELCGDCGGYGWMPSTGMKEGEPTDRRIDNTKKDNQ